jgi:hypothetical protein
MVGGEECLRTSSYGRTPVVQKAPFLDLFGLRLGAESITGLNIGGLGGQGVVEDFGRTPVVHKGLLREIFDLKLGTSDRPDLDAVLAS